MEHYVGRIFNFCHVPVQKAIVIDIPFYEQDPEILTNEILINIKKNDVKQEVRNRYDQINALPADLLSIIKKLHLLPSAKEQEKKPIRIATPNRHLFLLLFIFTFNLRSVQ